jgi:hypothetical protein
MAAGDLKNAAKGLINHAAVAAPPAAPAPPPDAPPAG